MNINDLVLNEIIGIKLGELHDNEIGPNAKIEPKNLGLSNSIPEPDLKSNPDFYKNFNKSLKTEKPDLYVPTNLSTGFNASERLRKAIQTKHKLSGK